MIKLFVALHTTIQPMVKLLDLEFSDFELLGQGAYGKVLALNDKLVAKVQNDVTIERFLNEVELHDRCYKAERALFVTMFDSYPKSITFTMERAYKDLATLCKSPDRCAEPELHRMATQLVKAVKMMHKLDIIHTDLKPENILVFRDSEGNWYLKVTDFGTAIDLTRPYDMEELRCTSDWSNLVYQEYTKATDLWSVGLCIHVLLQWYNGERYQPMFAKPTDLRQISHQSEVDVKDSVQYAIVKHLRLEPNRTMNFDKPMRVKHFFAAFPPNAPQKSLAITHRKYPAELTQWVNDLVRHNPAERHLPRDSEEETSTQPKRKSTLVSSALAKRRKVCKPSLPKNPFTTASSIVSSILSDWLEHWLKNVIDDRLTNWIASSIKKGLF